MPLDELSKALAAALLAGSITANLAAQVPNALGRNADPSAAFESATEKFDLVRQDPGNWSEIERVAFKEAKAHAKASCSGFSVGALNGTDLLAYGRLCAFGELWEAVYSGASAYLAAARQIEKGVLASMEPDLRLAFALKIEADLRLEKPREAFQDSTEMLDKVSYAPETSLETDTAINYLQFAAPDDAMTLLQARQAVLLLMIREHGTPRASLMSLGTLSLSKLYSDALMLPIMCQYLRRNGAEQLFAEIEQALPSAIPPNEADRISLERSRYQLIGSRLPQISVDRWLFAPTATGHLPDINQTSGAATVLMIFPSWCARCIGSRSDIVNTWNRLRADDVRFFVLLSQEERFPDLQEKRLEHSTDLTSAKKGESKSPLLPGEKAGLPHVEFDITADGSATSLLSGTPTFVVSQETRKSFFSPDVPLFLILDRNGFVRVIASGEDNALVPGGPIDQLVDTVSKRWP